MPPASVVFRHILANVGSHAFSMHTANLNHSITFVLSHHHSTSALVSEILTSMLQTVQKNNNNLHMDSMYLQTVQKISTHSVL